MEEQNNNHVSKNPFDDPRYKEINLPDEALPVAGNMIEAMISNDEYPDELKQEYPWIFNKDNVLGFLDEPRKAQKLLNFDIIKLDILSTMPRKAFTFNTELNFDILRNILEVKLDRAVGAPNVSGHMNERKSLISQISENRQVSESDDGLVKESFIKKLIGRNRR